MKKKVKILYIINDITMPGGLSRVTYNLLNDLEGFDCNIYVTVLSAATKYQSISHPRIDLMDMPPLHGRSKLGKMIWYLKLKKRIEKYVNSRDIDIVIAVGSAMTVFSSFLTFKVAQLWGAEHSAYNSCSRIRKLLKRWRYPKLNRLICLTEFDKKSYYDRYLKDVICIPNYTNYSGVKVSYSNRNSCCFIGRLNDIKGVDYLIDVIEKVSTQRPDWLFEIYGEGDKKAWLINEVSSRKLSSIVRINDPIEDVSFAYQNSGMLILTSRNEGFPMVLLEAQAHGLPVVSFDCETGPSEIISDGEDGYLITPFDTNLFAQRVLKIIDDENLRLYMSDQAFNKTNKFSRASVINLWIEQFKIP